MPFVHRLLYAMRDLADEEPHPSKRKQRKGRTPENSSSKHRQAVAFVLTFRDLFASGGLNFLLEDMETNRSSGKMKHNNSQCMLKDECKTSSPGSFTPNTVKVSETLKVALESEGPLVCAFADSRDTRVPLLREEQPSRLPDCKRFESPSRFLVPVAPETGALELYGRKKHKTLTVPLPAEDEKKTVDALRKVLKWSPRKQSLAKFSVPLPKEEEYKAVAVVQNAVNRVKEEQQQKRRRKFKLFKLSFC